MESARPTYASPIPEDTDLSVALAGAELLGVGLFEQGRQVAGLLEARDDEGGALYPDAVVQMPRRSTKTTSVMATILGRAKTREGYRCVITAQSGNIASRILLDHAEMMIRAGHCVESREARSGTTATAVLYRNGGREHLDFPATGARVWVVPPDAGAVRSAAADDIVIEEAGEHDPERFAAFMTGVLPLMDTRGPLAQLIMAGTPGVVRQGPFWEALEAGRNGTEQGLGILDYSARDDDDPEDRAVWARVHPGPSSIRPDGSPLTPMATLEKRFAKLGAVRFAREYLCQWPPDFNVSAIDQQTWRDRAVPGLTLPERFAISVDVAHTGEAAAVAAAWRDDDGHPCAALLEYRPGFQWVPDVVKAIKTKHGRNVAAIAIDDIGMNKSVLETLERMRVKVTRPGMKSMQGACVTFVADLPHHQDQPPLNAAVGVANWRVTEGGRLFGRKSAAADISPLVACAEALWAYDQAPVRQPLTIVSSAG